MFNFLKSIPTDKLLHFLGGYFVCSSLSLFIPLYLAFFVCVGVAFYKEMWDLKGNGTYEEADFAITVLGGATYFALLYVKGLI